MTLIVTDDAGQTGTTTGGVTVTAASSQIVAAFVFSPTDPATGPDGHFDSTPSSTSPGFTITGYAWDFGDGHLRHRASRACAGTDAKPTHAFASGTRLDRHG